MTNEEKARDIGDNYYENNISYAAEAAAIEMGEWKDNQLKQLLSEHIEHATGQRLEVFMDLYRELFEQNAPEIPQTTRLSTYETDIANLLSTPRELCKNCYNWCTQEDVGTNDFPHCIENAYDCRAYLLGTHDNCPKLLVL